MDRKELADLIFPDVKDVSYYEEKYPERELKEGAQVVRVAPSPTGFIHVGGIFQGLIAKKIAKQTEGVFFVRIEDTDQKRKIENGTEEILNAYKDYDLYPDETVAKGNYGPYIQSERKEIYKAYAKKLVEEGNAYPCFCSTEELDTIRENQTKAQERTGYFGKWAKCRNMPVDMAIEKIKNGDPYIVRFKSPGNPDKKIKIKDVIKGGIDMPENDQDIVIIKSDGLPTYHFAHAVDDHLMHTTLVTRSDEWLSSVPLHIQLFQVLGFKVPKFAHTAPLEKAEEESRRKLSKRKDPEAAVSYYTEEGIPKEALKEYLMNIANSNFEIWRKQNPDKDMMEDFEFNLNKMGVSGALFDTIKLLDVAKGVISRFTAQEVYDFSYAWAEKYDQELKEMLDDKEYSLKVLGIERENAKPRKDISKWSEVKDNISYMYKDKFAKVKDFEYQKINDKEEIKKIVTEYITNYFDINDDKQTWFDKMKDLAEKLGYAREVKEYKANPENYKGHVGDISTVIRITLTGRANTPDLYEIMQVLGEKEVLERLA
ncbi:MAG: glutamate--tRNA ligase [Clostridia bacterium]|jgi:glutamyl-tRNA synthetase|nr:glutamate--tRNA ligase [Clostridia bacterium]